MMDLQGIERLFAERFREPAAIVLRAPGRVNLIGEHTDYNDGFVLPFAIGRAVWIALRPRADREVHVWSSEFTEMAQFSLDRLERGGGGPAWADYVKGTAWALEGAGHRLGKA
jgi:galactokinase